MIANSEINENEKIFFHPFYVSPAGFTPPSLPYFGNFILLFRKQAGGYEAMLIWKDV